MGDIVNLRRLRKARQKEAESEAAAVNRARHGRTAAEREHERLLAEQEKRRLDGLKHGER